MQESSQQLNSNTSDLQEFPLPASAVQDPRDLVLSYAGFALPHTGKVEQLLKDGDHIEVSMATSARRQRPPPPSSLAPSLLGLPAASDSDVHPPKSRPHVDPYRGPGLSSYPPQSAFCSDGRRVADRSHGPSMHDDPYRDPGPVDNRRRHKGKRGRSPPGGGDRGRGVARGTFGGYDVEAEEDRGLSLGRGRSLGYGLEGEENRGRGLTKGRSVDYGHEDDRGRSYQRGNSTGYGLDDNQGIGLAKGRSTGYRLEEEDRGRSMARGRSQGHGLEQDRDRGKSVTRGRSNVRSVGYSQAIVRYPEPPMERPERDSALASQVSTRERALSGYGLVEGFKQNYTCHVCRDIIGLPLEKCLVKPKVMRAHVAAHILVGWEGWEGCRG